MNNVAQCFTNKPHSLRELVLALGLIDIHEEKKEGGREGETEKRNKIYLKLQLITNQSYSNNLEKHVLRSSRHNKNELKLF